MAAVRLRAHASPARAARSRHRRRRPPPTSSSKRSPSVIVREMPGAVSGQRHGARRPPLRRPARRCQPRGAGRRASRSSSSIYRRSSRSTAAELSRANQVDALLLKHDLEYDRWKFQTLQEYRWNPLIYTRIAGDALYNLLARDFAPLPERLAHLGKRLDEMPRFLAQVREALDPARVPKVHAETAAKQNAGLISMLDGEIAAQIATLPADDQERPARQHRESAHAPSRNTRSGSRSGCCRKRRAISASAPALYDQKLAFALFSPLSREEIRARAESELAATRDAMYEIAREVLKDKRRSPRTPETPSDAQRQRRSRPRSSSRTPNGRTRRRARHRARVARRRDARSCARRTS